MIDPTACITHSHQNCSNYPVTTARYVVEIVMNEDLIGLSDEEMKKSLSDEIQRVMDEARFTEDLRYDYVNFEVLSREVLDVAPANYEEQK